MAFDYSFIGDIASGFDFGIGGILVPIAIALAATLIVSTHTRDIRLLMFPIFLGFMQLGLNIHPIAVIFTAVVWAVTLVGGHIIGETLSGVADAGKGLYQNTVGYRSTKRAKDLKNTIDIRQNTFKEELAAHNIGKILDKAKGIEKEEINKKLGTDQFGLTIPKIQPNTPGQKINELKEMNLPGTINKDVWAWDGQEWRYIKRK